MKTYVVDWCENCKKQYSLDYENYKTKVLTGDNICYHQFIKKKNNQTKYYKCMKE